MYNYASSVVVSFSVSERGYEGIVTVTVSPDGVRLYFNKSLPDPEGLLEGSGGKVRYVTVEAASDLDRGPIHALIKAAIEHAGVAFPRTPSAAKMIFKSESKKRKR